MSDACTPRARWAEGEAARRIADWEAREGKESRLAEQLARGEQASLSDPARPRVLRPADWPEQITVRIEYAHLPGEIIAETGADQENQTSQKLTAGSPEIAMAGAEVALAALGYTLDRFRLYADMSLMVGKFYRKAGPYA